MWIFQHPWPRNHYCVCVYNYLQFHNHWKAGILQSWEIEICTLGSSSYMAASKNANRSGWPCCSLSQFNIQHKTTHNHKIYATSSRTGTGKFQLLNFWSNTTGVKNTTHFVTNQMVSCVHRTHQDGISFMWPQPSERCLSTPLWRIKKQNKKRYRKLFTYVSAVSLH